MERNTCNNLFTLECINGQSSSSAPPDVTGFTAVQTTPSSISLAWTGAGSTTANYQIAYQTGGTAPANCTSGTLIPAAAFPLNGASYAVTGLGSSTTYSFRLCAANSDVSAFSTGVTVTASTTSSGNTNPLGSDQFIFASSSLYSGALGNLYFGDFACQTEAVNAGFAGTWKMVASDNSTAASSRITVTGDVYNFRPVTSGGSQIVSDSTNFWNGIWYNAVNYTAFGLTPPQTPVWTGTTQLGAASGTSCNGWTTVANTSNGTFGTNNNAGSSLNSGNTVCSNPWTIYCTNQQTSAATPPNAASFNNYLLGPTSAGFTFTSGGGTTAGYQIAYQTGAAAPANCTSGTVVPAMTIGLNPAAYTVSGLSASTQYSFRICAVNSDSSAFSSGLTMTITTESTGSPVSENITSQQLMFATATTYEGYFGGIYYGDFICQQEASSAGFGGTWKAVLGDESTDPSSHVNLTGNPIFNTRPASSGGIQVISYGTGFWSGPYSNQANYAAAGGPPGNARVWTGSTNAGLKNTGNTCTSWTTAASTINGEIGATTTPSVGVAWFAAGCSNYYSLYCINQQSSAAPPPDASNFTAYSTGSAQVGLAWTPGGSTTGAYQIAYRTGASAPTSCTSGTVIPASTLGVNPSTYTVTGLTAGTQYSFLLCAYNSDLTSSSTGVSVTVTTSSSGVNYNLGTNQFVFSTAATYYGEVGGIYFSDYACQMEANNAGLGGTWKAVIGDASNAVSSHISLSGPLYNMRSVTAGGRAVYFERYVFPKRGYVKQQLLLHRHGRRARNGKFLGGG